MTLRAEMKQLAAKAKEASHALSQLQPGQKNQALLAMAGALETASPAILQANALDVKAAQAAGIAPAMLDRLRLDDKRVAAMAGGLREVASLPDPVGRVIEERARPNGLRLQKVSVPIGVIVIIYEARPNVTADAAGLCFKAGNATILRGGKEALHSNRLIGQVMLDAGRACMPEFPEGAIQVVQTTDRQAVPALLAQTGLVDLCIPRGGEALIRAVTRCAKVPVIKHYKGVCHVYVDGQADLDMAEAIALNAKVQRPAVCNAMETLLVDRAVARSFLPRVATRLAEHGVELRVDRAARAALKTTGLPLKTATAKDWTTEYNDLILSIRVVDGLPDAIDHINRYGSSHSDAIVTGDAQRAQQFLHQVDSATVYWNASTRFTDGAEFGMGAEIGISTDRIGARGPMGLEELTSYKWLAYGTGQVRG